MDKITETDSIYDSLEEMSVIDLLKNINALESLNLIRTDLIFENI